MPVSLKKGQKVSLTKDNPGLSKVIVGIGWDINQFDTGTSFSGVYINSCILDRIDKRQ